MTSTNLFRVSASMNRLRLFVCCVVAAGLGCKKDATFTEPIPNYAHITWLNAVSDTMQLDLRVIDIPTNASFEDADFRSAQFFPINIEPGARHVRVFLSSSIDSIAKKVVLDTTYTFVDGEPYSFYVTGRARAGSAQPVRALITNLNVGSPGPGQFALRIVNLAPTLGGAIGAMPDTAAGPDVFVLAPGATATGTPTAAGLAYGAATTFMVLDTGTYRIALLSPGTTTPAGVLATVPPGTPAGGGNGAVAGSRVGGSMLTAVILPRSVPGSVAPQTRAGQGASQATDTSVSEASRRITLNGDTVTVQVGSLTQLVNRRDSTGKRLADTTLRRTGTGAASPVVVGNTIFVAGATQAEYNGWQGVMAIADTLMCIVADPGDVVTGPNRSCKPPADTTVASRDTAITRFRFRYRIVGTPVTPGTGAPTYRIYASTNAATDFVIPQVEFLVDKRP